MPGIKDVAVLAGVSISTVSNVLNGTKNVSSETTERVLAAARQLNYQADGIARSMKRQHSKLVGVIIPSICRVFFPQVISGIQAAADEAGYTLLIYSSEDSVENEKMMLNTLLNFRVDGIILDTLAPDTDKEYLSSLKNLSSGKKDIPVIGLERNLTLYGLDSVFIDNHTSSALITQQLIFDGAKRIAFLNAGLGNSRLEGYIKTLHLNGLALDENLIINGEINSPLGGYNCTKQLIASGQRFDAIIGANDQIAIGAIGALKEHGYRIPEDVSVVGFDNIFIASIIDPPLTTIDVPKYNMGFSAFQALLRRIEDKTFPPDAIELPIEIILRQSTISSRKTSWDLDHW